MAIRPGRTKIADETLLLFASTEMLTSERFPRSNNDWEDRSKRNKTWANWKTAHKKSHVKARVKALVNDGSVKFGAANSAARQEYSHLPLGNQLEEDSGDLKPLKGYFDNLVAAAVNGQGFLKQLVLNNTTLTTSNESLVDLMKKQGNDIKNLEREISRLKREVKLVQGTPPYAPTARKKDFTSIKIVLN